MWRGPKAIPAFNNAGKQALKVPGFGLPIDFELDWSGQRFRHGTNDFHADRMTVREVTMIRFMDAITDKPDWDAKIFNEEIIAKWHDEALAQTDGLMSEDAFEWCLRELRDNAKLYAQETFVRTLEAGSRCIKSDILIPNKLRDELREAVQPLLAMKESTKDWHPYSNDQVLNLVHPSLYPLVYGRTRVLSTGQVGLKDCLESCGKGDIAASGQDVEAERRGIHYRSRLPNREFWSTRFQWLPAEIKFQGDTGTDVRITSYINNLRPGLHQDLYNVVEKLISKAIPLWNRILIPPANPRPGVFQRESIPLRIKVTSAEIDTPEPPQWAHDLYGDLNEEQLAKIREYLAQPDDPGYSCNETHGYLDDPPEDWENDLDENGDWPAYRVVEWKHQRMRKVIHPNPNFLEYGKWREGSAGIETSLEDQFRPQGLQVIVKLSSIELTPEKPDYDGGNWHLEGMLNEHIVATAIYYYDVENVTPSRLSFRQEADLHDMDLSYEQDDHEPLARIFGTDSMRDEPAVQAIGSIATPANRFLVFPNTRQHKVEPFSLADPSKPGHRRFIILWLVDPHYRICSTANVPPQQPEWIEDAARATGFGEKLPPELMKIIMEYAKSGLMSLEEAKKMRLELMSERTVYQQGVEQSFDEYNLCEH